MLNTEELVASPNPYKRILGLHILSRSFQFTLYKPSNHVTYIERLYIGHKQTNRLKIADIYNVCS